MAIDLNTFKQTMSLWASGVSIITTVYNGEKFGMTASSFSSVSIDPMLVMISVGKQNSSHDAIKHSGFFAVNILQVNQVEWGKRFAGMFPNVQDRFEGISTQTAETGAPILPDVMGWADCRVYHAYEGGDHTIFVGEVVAAQAKPIQTSQASQTSHPLLYFQRQWGEFVSPAHPRLTHIVLMRLHEPTTENFALMRQELLALKSKIPQIRSIEVGTNIVKSDRAYDLALTVRFDSLQALDEYQVHPEHVRVLTEVIRPRVSSVVAADYED